MKKVNVLGVSLAAMGMLFNLTGAISISQAGQEQAERKIVVFKQGVSEEMKDAAVKKHGGIKIKNLKLVNGRSALISKKAENALKNEKGVLRIDDDVIVEALARPDGSNEFNDDSAKPDYAKKTGIGGSQLSQSLPWGIDRIDAEKVWPSGNVADPIKVAVIDTGIDVTHPDLKNNIKGGFSAVWYTTSYNDDNGHGTHVAGIAAAVDNSVGVVGVGPKIDLYAVKVLNRNGSGYLSDIIEGLDWAIANGMKVVNMSLGTSADVLSFREAVQRVNYAGIVQVAAAGNSGGAVIYPAAYPEVIAVSAINSSNTIASWSSRGPEIDLAAPGVNIYSTYRGSKYKTLSGTSMASPHVAGSAALVLNTAIATSTYDLNNNGIWDPPEIQKKLQDRAVDLGIPGFDNLYGWGMVNAYNAVQP